MKEKQQVPWWQPALILFIQLSGWIIVPIIVAMFLGQWLDSKYGTEPWLYITSVGIAFLMSVAGITMEVLKYKKQIDKTNKLEKENKNE